VLNRRARKAREEVRALLALRAHVPGCARVCSSCSRVPCAAGPPAAPTALPPIRTHTTAPQRLAGQGPVRTVFTDLVSVRTTRVGAAHPHAAACSTRAPSAPAHAHTAAALPLLPRTHQVEKLTQGKPQPQATPQAALMWVSVAQHHGSRHVCAASGGPTATT
jgi:hypothetical protein